MKQEFNQAVGRAAASIAMATIAALSFSGCAALSGAVGSINPLSGIQESVEKRANAEIASGTGLTAMTRKMMFNVMYAQVFFVGGFSPTLYNLEETQGAVWKMESKDKDDDKASVVTTERALLKRNADGSSWWYLSWKAEDEEWIFEALMDKEMMAKKIRYYNADVQRVEEAVFDDPGAAAPADKSKAKAKGKAEPNPAPSEAPASDFSAKDMATYSKGKESVKVGAGTFKAEKIVWDWKDDEGKSYAYTWWVDAKTPGGLVKFNYAGDGSSLKGELVSLKKGYATIYKSF